MRARVRRVGDGRPIGLAPTSCRSTAGAKTDIHVVEVEDARVGVDWEDAESDEKASCGSTIAHFCPESAVAGPSGRDRLAQLDMLWLLSLTPLQLIASPDGDPRSLAMSLDAHPAGAAAHRIRLARRAAGLSQSQLALELGVQRSAVSHWEAQRGKPSMNHLRQLALLTGVQFEWIATGRGPMTPSAESLLDSVAAVDALLVDDPQERRLLAAFREAPVQARLPLLELAEQLASQRLGRARQRSGTASEGLL